MTDLLSVLQVLGFEEVCPDETGEWVPISEVNGRLCETTTEEVYVLVHNDWTPTCRLVDPGTDERVAVAREPKGA